MRKFLMSSAVALALTGCATTPTSSINIPQVQSLATSICGFLPLATTVLGLFGTNPLASALDVATLICNAVVPTKSAARLRASPARGPIVVNGIVIQGQFVR